MTESDHRGALEAEGYPEEVQDEAFLALRAAGMLRRVRSQALGEDVIYSPYVWGTEAVDIAEFLNKLPANERQVLSTLSRTVAEQPGTSLDWLQESRLVAGAQNVGRIDSTRVVTTGGSERGFAFSPQLENALRYSPTDVAHERKMFVAHILYGHRYSRPGYGRIGSPIVLVDALIRRGQVGPATSISSDYPLLEAKGIVKVETLPGGRAIMKLVKEDVAKDSLELLRHALGEGDEPAEAGNPLESLWLPGTYMTPERNRHRLPARTMQRWLSMCAKRWKRNSGRPIGFRAWNSRSAHWTSMSRPLRRPGRRENSCLPQRRATCCPGVP